MYNHNNIAEIQNLERSTPKNGLVAKVLDYNSAINCSM